MPLQPCAECGREISTSSRSCPHCGAPADVAFKPALDSVSTEPRTTTTHQGKCMHKSQMYSPNQIAGGSFWGGPIAAVYFLRENFLVLGKTHEAQLTLIGGAAFIVILIGLLPFLPDKFPNMAIPLLYCLSAKQIASSWQLSKDAIANSDQFTFRSNWRIFGVGFAFMVLFLVIALAVMFVLDLIGVISLA